MSYLKQHGTRRVPQWVPIAGLEAGREQRRRLRLGGRRLDAPAPLPRPRLGGRQLLRRRVEADARERRRPSSAASRPTARARSPRSSRSASRAARRRTTRRSSRSRWRQASATSATRKAALDALPRVARTGTHLFQFAQFVEGFRGWGRRCGAVGALVRVASRSTRSPTRRSSTASATASTHRDLLRLAHPARRGQRRQPDARRSRTTTRGCSSGSSAAARRTACRALVEGFVARPGGRDAGRDGRARPRVRPAARGAPSRAPDLAGGLGGAARGHADDGADPQPRDDDAGRRARRRARPAPRRWSRSSATASASAGRGCTRSRCWPRSGRTRRVAASAASDDVERRCGAGRRRARRRVLHGVRATSSRRARACCSRSTCRARWTCGSVAGVPGLTPRDASAALALVTAATEPRYEIVGFYAGRRGW